MAFACLENIMKIYGGNVRFPLLIKNGRLFLWRKRGWLNIKLRSSADGGYVNFFYHLLRCYMGIHRYGGVFSMKTLETRRECMYCRKEEPK